MLDIKKLREETEKYIELLERRGSDFSYIHDVLKQDERRREIIVQVEKVKALRNQTSKLIGQYKREGKDASEIFSKVESIGEDIKDLEVELKELEEKIRYTLLITPNIPKEDVPVGKDEEDNIEIRKVGTIPTFDFEPKPHWDLGTDLDILDFDRASKISGSRFTVYKGLGARLERSLINLFLVSFCSIKI